MSVDEELRRQLESVKDTYYDFLFCGNFLKNDKDKLTVIDYIKSNPDATTSDVLEKIAELRGIETVA